MQRNDRKSFVFVHRLTSGTEDSYVTHDEETWSRSVSIDLFRLRDTTEAGNFRDEDLDNRLIYLFVKIRMGFCHSSKDLSRMFSPT